MKKRGDTTNYPFRLISPPYFPSIPHLLLSFLSSFSSRIESFAIYHRRSRERRNERGRSRTLFAYFSLPLRVSQSSMLVTKELTKREEITPLLHLFPFYPLSFPSAPRLLLLLMHRIIVLRIYIYHRREDSQPDRH